MMKMMIIMLMKQTEMEKEEKKGKTMNQTIIIQASSKDNITNETKGKNKKKEKNYKAYKQIMDLK